VPSHSDSDTVEYTDSGADNDPGLADSGPVDSDPGAANSASTATDRDSDANDLADPDLLPED
jgi:hypothetical protein